ncbi:MAG: hypothetical protein ISP41_06770 [Alphaproteobacteria bacterium]|jgi:pseudouridine kinase|nr:hypothetical protein [Alphaproteobacteria bacterium]
MGSRVICFGAAHVDFRAQSLAPLIEGSSNPVKTSRARGGVAGNVAGWLATLGHEVFMVTRVGTDADGTFVLDELTRLGVRCDAVMRDPDYPTATYTAAIEPSGELRLGLADMSIHDDFTPEQIDQALKVTGTADLWFLDANLPETAIRHLATRAPTSAILSADTVSVTKAPRIRAACPRLDLLITNEDEATTLLACDTAAAQLSAVEVLGVGRTIIGHAARGVTLLDHGSRSDFTPLPCNVVDVTGGGDALAAGLLHGILEGVPMADAVRLGLAAAAFAVESETPHPAGVDAADLLARASIQR